MERRPGGIIRAMAHVEHSRSYWNALAQEYQERHNPHLRIERPGWGVWQIPEDEVRALGDFEGKAVLELGCGAAQWSLAHAPGGLLACSMMTPFADVCWPGDAERPAGELSVDYFGMANAGGDADVVEYQL